MNDQGEVYQSVAGERLLILVNPRGGAVGFGDLAAIRRALRRYGVFDYLEKHYVTLAGAGYHFIYVGVGVLH